MKFNGKLLIIGCGAVSQCAIPLVLKLIDMPSKNITIMDFVDNRSRGKYTLHTRHMEIRKRIETWGDNKGTTAIIDHGANPGLVSHFTKHALLGIAEKILKEKPGDPRRPRFEKALADKNFAKLAQLSGVKVIHISERDTQITDKPKRVNEFVNTWSIEGFFEEGVAPAE